MPPTEHRPAELEDLDRYVGQVLSDDQMDRMQAQFDRLFRERWAAQERANAAMHAERDRRANVRKLYRLAAVWVVVSLVMAGVAFYLRAHGE